MRLVRLVAAFGTGAMLAAIPAGFAAGAFLEEGGQLIDLAWGRVTLIDIELAFLFGWLWIAWRERSGLRAAAWAVATLVTGSLALFGYLLGASLRTDDPIALLLGPRRVADRLRGADRPMGADQPAEAGPGAVR